MEDSFEQLKAKVEKDGDASAAKAMIDIERELRRMEYRKALLDEEL